MSTATLIPQSETMTTPSSAAPQGPVMASTPDKEHISFSCLKLYKDLKDAQQAAGDAAAATGGTTYPCIISEQGGRLLISTNFAMASLRRLLIARPADKGKDPTEAGNRPLIPEHAKAIQKYLVENHTNYVLPPFTLTYREELSVFTIDTKTPLRQGWLVVGDGQVAHITDGQHRYYALVGYEGKNKSVQAALDLCPDLLKNAVAVQVMIEPDLRRIHQDFADMAHTKELPKSLLTAYDLRDPANRLVHEVIAHSKLLKGRVDSTSKTLSKGSRHVVLANWIRNLVKGAVATDYFVADEEFPRFVQEGLATPDQVELLQSDLDFLMQVMTDSIDPLAKIAAIDPVSPEANKVPDLREDVIATTAVGLGILGMVLRVIRMNIPDAEVRRDKIRSLFTTISWNRKSLDSAFTNGGVLTDGTIKSARTNIFVTAGRILQRIGLEPTAQMTNHLQKSEKAQQAGSTARPGAAEPEDATEDDSTEAEAAADADASEQD